MKKSVYRVFFKYWPNDIYWPEKESMLVIAASTHDAHLQAANEKNVPSDTIHVVDIEFIGDLGVSK